MTKLSLIVSVGHQVGKHLFSVLCPHTMGLLERLYNLLDISDKPTQAIDPYAELNALRQMDDRGKLCNAPFRAIRFEQRGVVRTCCFNRQVVLGRYPEMSIQQIWNSTEANALRKKITDNDLSYGCQLCEKQLKRGEYDTVKLRQYDGLPSSDTGYPTMLDFSIHNTCNLECVMCHGEFSSSIRKNREKLPPVPLIYDAGFVKQLEEFIPHAKQFVFAGGEPFLIELYYDIWESINSLNPTDVHIVTNGTILNNRVKQILQNGKYHITHSIESFDKVKYEQIRKNAGLERVLENMEYFMQYCKERGTEYAINVCPIQQNWKEIPEFVKFCNDRAIKLYVLSVVYPPTASLMSLPAKQLEEIETFYRQFSFKGDNQLEQHNISNFNDLVSRVSGWKETAIQKENGIVDAAVSVDEDEQFDLSVVLDLLTEKIKDFGRESPEVSADSINYSLQRIQRLYGTFEGRKVTKGKITEIENIAADVMIGVINSAATEQEFDLVVRDHILDR